MHHPSKRRRWNHLSVFLMMSIVILTLALFLPCSCQDSTDDIRSEEVATDLVLDEPSEDGDGLEKEDEDKYSPLVENDGKISEDGDGLEKEDEDKDSPLVENDDKINETFDVLYTEGIQAYTDQLWSSCAFKIESALNDYRNYSKALTECSVACSEDTKTYKMSNFSSNVAEFTRFFSILKMSDCFRRCKDELVGKRNPVSVEMELAFEEMGPYLYLQYCYFKLDKYKMAASSTLTYYLRNPEHNETRDNILYYRDTLQVPKSDFVDLEITPFKENYIYGVLAYQDEDFQSSIGYLEQSIEEYLKGMKECYAMCLVKSNSRFNPEFLAGIADSIYQVMTCHIGCESKQSIVYSDPVPLILQEIFNYLQYSYYAVEDYEKSAEAMATFLHMNETHEIMNSNLEIVKRKLKDSDGHLVPRKNIQEYVNHRREMANSLDFITKNYKWPHVIEDEAIEYEDLMEKLKKEPDDWMTRYERLGMRLIAKDVDLHREERFVTDGILKQEQCDELKSLLDELPYGSDGVKIFNFTTAQELLRENPDDKSDAFIRLLIRAADVIRDYVDRLSQEKMTLWVKYSSIICFKQNPFEDKSGCYLQEDGTCVNFEEMPDELSPGLFTTVTYLNGIDDDGDFYFLNERKEKDGSFGVKCGRTVGFNTGDRHSLNIPDSKERCGYIMRYTTDKHDNDEELSKTIGLLKRIEELRRERYNITPAEIMKSFKNKGVKIEKTGKELKGNERFLADGLASEEQCSSLKNMILKYGQRGDGYRGDESPHTVKEIFAGLTLTTLVELYHSGSVSSVAFETFMELSENSKQLVEGYFNLTKPLYFDFTHLVCRTAKDDLKLDRDDLSHPVHADNCILKPNGSCSKEFPAFTQRHYSAILYMNDDFQGGEFFFAHSNKSEQISIRPKCGRLVGFNAGEFHGVRAVLAGQRCALALWFTTDRNYRELAHIHAKQVLKRKQQLDATKKTVTVHDDL